jgi:hypothetical protein
VDGSLVYEDVLAAVRGHYKSETLRCVKELALPSRSGETGGPGINTNKHIAKAKIKKPSA